MEKILEINDGKIFYIKVFQIEQCQPGYWSPLSNQNLAIRLYPQALKTPNVVLVFYC